MSLDSVNGVLSPCACPVPGSPRTKKYKDEFTVKVPSDEGKHYLYVRSMDDDDNLCDYERFTYSHKIFRWRIR